MLLCMFLNDILPFSRNFIRKVTGIVGVSQNKMVTTGVIRSSCNSSDTCIDQPNTSCVAINGNEVCECALGYLKNTTNELCQG